MKKITALVLLSSLWASALSADWEGHTAWAGLTKLSSPLSGLVEQVLVMPGEEVAKGQLLLRMEQGVLRARVAEAEATSHFARLQQQETAKELGRAEELYERTLLADHELDLARIEAARGMAEYRSAQAEERAAREALAHSELRAPFAARVLSRHVVAGEAVVNRLYGMPMLVLAKSEQMLVALSLPAQQMAGLAHGMSLAVEVAGERYPATVQAISYDLSSGSYQVEVLFVPSRKMMAGMPARVRLP